MEHTDAKHLFDEHCSTARVSNFHRAFRIKKRFSARCPQNLGSFKFQFSFKVLRLFFLPISLFIWIMMALSKERVELALLIGLEQGFPNWGTCTPSGTFAYVKGYI